MLDSFWIIKIIRGARRGEIIVGTIIIVTVIVVAIFAGLQFSSSASAQAVQGDFPSAQNQIIARIFDSSNQPTNIQPLIIVSNGQLHVSVPEPKSSFRPGRYKMKLWIWKDGAIYYTENDFTWGVLAVNFNKSIYNLGDKAKIAFGVLDDAGRTICDADLKMDITSPSRRIYHFETRNNTNTGTNNRENIGGNSSSIGGNLWIERISTCGPGTVTNNPDYSAALTASETGTYNVSVVADTANGTRQISDSFQVQNPPMFDVERLAPTRIYPPATYQVTIPVKANADFSGNIVETAPASFNISISAPSTSSGQAGAPQKSFTHESQTLSWPVNMKKGDSVTIGYSFKAPDVSPELYKLGPLQIGNWQEARQWQIAADAVVNTVIFVSSTAATTWTVPSDWNNASNSIEVIGAGGGATHGTSTGRGAGGGGGAYAKITNWVTSTTGGLVPIEVGIAGLAASSSKATTGTVTMFGSSVMGLVCAGTNSFVCAAGGGAAATSTTNTTGGSGGTTANSSGTTLFAGGSGANGSSTRSGGGGGAASFCGVGSSTTGGNGGNGGCGAAGGGPGTSGSAGTNGSEWTATGGSTGGAGGGGGGATGSSGTGGAGGTFGAAGGGARNANAPGASKNGVIVITYTPATITLADGTQPAGVTVGPTASNTPGFANAVTSTVFSFVTNFGTSSITLATTTISTSTGVYQVMITNASHTTIYGSSTNPGTSTLSISLSGLTISTTTTNFNIMISPLNATSMPATPISGSGSIGELYVVTSTFSDWTSSSGNGVIANKSGANTTSSHITIDNDSPNDVTSDSGTAGNGQVSFTWTNPGDLDFATTTVVRTTSTTGVTWRPGEGTYYTTGTISGTATNTIACAVASSTSNCIDTNVTNGTTYYYMIFTADNYLNYSSGTIPTGNPFTPSSNSPPTVSNVVLNHTNAITLTPNATTSFDINWSVSDTNGCSDINTNKATSTAFRFGVRSTCAVPSPTTSSLNCYFYATRTTSTCSGTTINVTDTVQIYYFAQSTGDPSSSFPNDHWEAYAIAGDAANATSSATSTAVNVNVLLALNITTSTINYGTVSASSTTGSTNQTTTIQNVGNASQTLQIYGTAPTLGSNSIATSSQHYATSSFTFGGAEQLLNAVAQAVAGFLLTTPTSTSAVQGDIFWGITVPAGNPTGTYSGTNTFTAIFSQ